MGCDYKTYHRVILYFDNGLEDIIELYDERCWIPDSNEEDIVGFENYDHIQAVNNYIEEIEKERKDVVYMCNGKWIEKEYVENWKSLIEKQVRKIQSNPKNKTANLIWVIKSAYMYHVFS